jgi:hypothetical protein
MMGAAHDLAESIRSGHAESLDAGLAAPAAFLADQVESLHNPPHPTDCVRSGDEFRQLWPKEGAMLRGTMPDVAMTDLTVTVVADDTVELSSVMRGTSPDGVTLAHPFRVTYTLDDGLIVRIVAAYDPAPLASLNEEVYGEMAHRRP